MKVSSQASALSELFPDGVFPSACPSRTVLNHVTSTWGVLVLAALTDGSLRWSELRRAVEGVSEKMLAQTLRTLEQDGFVHRDGPAGDPAAGRLQPDPARRRAGRAPDPAAAVDRPARRGDHGHAGVRR